MELLQLKYFISAAETQNFSKTAKKFTVPPSAISQSIKRLEKELGVLLFDRRANKISLNSNGQMFYTSVRESDRLLSEVAQKLTDSQKNMSGEIRIQILCNRRLVSTAIKEFSLQHPDVHFVLLHGPSSEEEYDLIISDQDISDLKYHRQILLTENIAVAFHKEHPLALQEDLRISDLSRENFITMLSDGSLYRITQKFCAQAGFTPQIAIQCDDPYYIRQYIEMGLGIGFVPLSSWKGQFSENLVCRTFHNLTRTTYVYWNPSQHSKSVKSFLEVLRRVRENDLSNLCV